MAQLNTKIKLYANQEIDFLKDVLLQDDGDGAYIKKWNLAIAEPTAEQLASYETAGNTAESNATIINTRKISYGAWQDQLDEIFTDIDAWKTRIAKVKLDNPKN
jgi:hypothetical protein|tara:strand:+ start:428 stop:739 length:312 start_codon:yes stop_codon:yes gene_type:complete